MMIAAYSDGSGGAYSVVRFDADRFIVVNRSNGVTKSPFTISGGTIFIQGDMYLDGSITASKLSVGTLSAISGNMGTLTAGEIIGGVVRSADNTVNFNLNTGLLLIQGI